MAFRKTIFLYVMLMVAAAHSLAGEICPYCKHETEPDSAVTLCCSHVYHEQCLMNMFRASVGFCPPCGDRIRLHRFNSYGRHQACVKIVAINMALIRSVIRFELERAGFRRIDEFKKEIIQLLQMNLQSYLKKNSHEVKVVSNAPDFTVYDDLVLEISSQLVEQNSGNADGKFSFDLHSLGAPGLYMQIYPQANNEVHIYFQVQFGFEAYLRENMQLYIQAVADAIAAGLSETCMGQWRLFFDRFVK